MIVKLVINGAGNPAGKLADAELHFDDGPLAGLKLVGFGVWEQRTGRRNVVTFPARSYTINGERRSFALLRPLVDGQASDRQASDRLRDLILDAYAQHENTRIEVK